MALFDARRTGNRLEPARIVATIAQLSNRIKERFPDAQLSQTCDELLRLSRETKLRAEWISRPIIGLRLGASVLIALIALALVGAFTQLNLSSGRLDVVVFVNFLNAGMNNIVIFAAVVFFLITIEARVKRRRSLIAIHELRSLAHVIDMHQLTKDPDRLLFRESNTKSSPTTDMDVFEMSRYLDYCSEMLSLTGKIAVIYGLHWQDAIAIREANDVERLTTGLSQKILQKIMILHGSAFVGGSVATTSESNLFRLSRPHVPLTQKQPAN